MTRKVQDSVKSAEEAIEAIGVDTKSDLEYIEALEKVEDYLCKVIDDAYLALDEADARAYSARLSTLGRSLLPAR